MEKLGDVEGFQLLVSFSIQKGTGRNVGEPDCTTPLRLPETPTRTGT